MQNEEIPTEVIFTEQIPREVPVTEGVTTEVLEDGRVIFTISKVASVRFKPEMLTTQFENVDTGDISWVIQFILIDPDAAEEDTDEFESAAI